MEAPPAEVVVQSTDDYDDPAGGGFKKGEKGKRGKGKEGGRQTPFRLFPF